MGFFAATEYANRRTPVSLVPKCGLCGLKNQCQSPLMPVDGKGKKRVLVLGEAPGADEDDCNKPFVGRAGQKLLEAMAKGGYSLREDCFITNALICRPPNNRTPTSAEVEYCRPNLVKVLNTYKPVAVLVLGKTALQSIIPLAWKDEVDYLGRWTGWNIPSQKLNTWICPTWHPSYLLRGGGGEEKGAEIAELFFPKHIAKAFTHTDHPWETVPDWSSEVRVVIDSRDAAKEIEYFLDRKMVAFDYETTTLKPDNKVAEIVCCSLSDGKNTIAYPWIEPAVSATKEFIKSPVGKIASNLKFEHRWTATKLGIEVNNWVWDTMQAAHVLDNRKGIAGLKFQSFVLLGQPAYSEAVEPYFQSKGSNSVNKIRRVDMQTLLKYCGLDSLLEYKVARLQMKQLGYKHG